MLYIEETRAMGRDQRSHQITGKAHAAPTPQSRTIQQWDHKQTWDQIENVLGFLHRNCSNKIIHPNVYFLHQCHVKKT